jgi:hypothetical protein
MEYEVHLDLHNKQRKLPLENKKQKDFPKTEDQKQGENEIKTEIGNDQKVDSFNFPRKENRKNSLIPRKNPDILGLKKPN